jgi:hypothetical protein
MTFTKSAYTVSLLIVGLGLAVNGYSQSFLTNGLVAYYPFNGNANDASGNGHNASVQGTYQYLTNGTLHLIGDGALFYSGGGYVALPNYGNLNSGFTISIWVANETDHGNSIYAEYYVYFDNNAGSDVHISQHDFGVGSPNAYVNFPLTIADYTPWKQLVLVYSPANSAAYLNSIKTGSTNNVTVSPFPMVNSAIGRHWWAGGANSAARMTMDVKNCRIYNRALSAAEVQQLYQYESSIPCTPHAATATAVIDHGFVVDATVTDGGCGYTNTPVVYIRGGGGTGATATAVVSGGVVVDIIITDAGFGYTSTPTIFISSPLGLEVVLIKAVKPAFLNLSLGTNYQMQISGNLNTWTNYGAAFTATNTSMVYPQYFDVDNWNSLYFRVQVSP